MAFFLYSLHIAALFSDFKIRDPFWSANAERRVTNTLPPRAQDARKSAAKCDRPLYPCVLGWGTGFQWRRESKPSHLPSYGIYYPSSSLRRLLYIGPRLCERTWINLVAARKADPVLSRRRVDLVGWSRARRALPSQRNRHWNYSEFIVTFFEGEGGGQKRISTTKVYGSRGRREIAKSLTI